MYHIVKHLHVYLVITSTLLFQFRYWRYQVGEHAMPKALKIIPHGVDTLLLLAGISLVAMLGMSLLATHWLMFKLLALAAYIVFGTLAMKRSGILQWLSYLLATLAVVYMILVATQKTALPSLAVLAWLN